MNNSNVIRNLKDFHAVASKLFKCGAKRITDEIHSHGYMGIKLIVGQKLNPAYDAAADPTKPLLTPGERQVEKNKLIKLVPDIRIVWVRPGMTAAELTKEFLIGIKKSLEIKAPVIDEDITGISTMSKPEKSDVEIAAEIAAGKQGQAEVSDFDDDTEEIGFDEEIVEPSTPNEADAIDNEEADVQSEPVITPPATNEILSAIESLNKNILTIASDVGELNKRIKKVEKKVK